MDIRILAMNPLKAPGNSRMIPAEFLRKTRFESVDVDNRTDLFRAFLHLFRHGSYLAGRFRSDAFRDRLTEILREEDFDVIQLEHLYLCWYLGDIRRNSRSRIVLRAQNVEHRIWRDYRRKSTRPLLNGYLWLEGRKLEKFEREMARLVDGVMAISPADALYFRDFAGKTAAIPFGIDCSSILPLSGQEEQTADFPAVYHLGSMDWRPNVQGLKWFVRDVLPLAVREMPDIRVCLAGRNMPRWFFNRGSRNLIVEGVMEDAAKYRSDKSILIVPLLSGSGIRIKILEAMARGETVISTSTGAAGIEAMDRHDLLIADTPEAFADCICRSVRSRSLRREIGRNAEKIIAERYDLKAIGRAMEQFYKSLLDGEPEDQNGIHEPEIKNH